jgi:hypothetical protein
MLAFSGVFVVEEKIGAIINVDPTQFLSVERFVQFIFSLEHPVK